MALGRITQNMTSAALLQNLNEPGATIDGVADAFVAARGDVWQPWVGKPAAN